MKRNLKVNSANACVVMASLSLLLSAIAISTSFYCNVNATKVTWDLIGVLSGILSTLVAIIVFMLGYNYITYERRVSKNTDNKIKELANSVDAIYLYFTNKENIVKSHNGAIIGALNGIVSEMDNVNKYMSEKLFSELIYYIEEVDSKKIELERSFKYQSIEALRRLDYDGVNKCIDFIENCTIRGGDLIQKS